MLQGRRFPMYRQIGALRAAMRIAKWIGYAKRRLVFPPEHTTRLVVRKPVVQREIRKFDGVWKWMLQSNVSAGETHTAIPDGIRAKKRKGEEFRRKYGNRSGSARIQEFYWRGMGGIEERKDLRKPQSGECR